MKVKSTGLLSFRLVARSPDRRPRRRRPLHDVLHDVLHDGDQLVVLVSHFDVGNGTAAFIVHAGDLVGDGNRIVEKNRL